MANKTIGHRLHEFLQIDLEKFVQICEIRGKGISGIAVEMLRYAQQDIIH